MGFGNKQDLQENLNISIHRILLPPLFLRVELETGKHQAQKYTFHPAFSVGFDLMGYCLARLALVAGHGASQHWVKLRDTSILDLGGQNCYEYHCITLKHKCELWP